MMLGLLAAVPPAPSPVTVGIASSTAAMQALVLRSLPVLLAVAAAYVGLVWARKAVGGWMGEPKAHRIKGTKGQWFESEATGQMVRRRTYDKHHDQMVVSAYDRNRLALKQSMYNTEAAAQRATGPGR